MKTKFFLILLLLFLLSICSLSDVKEVEEYATMFNDLDEGILQRHSYINSFIILKDGQIIFEEYYNNYDEESLLLVASVTKSFTSTLIGILFDQGKIDLEESVVKYFSEYEQYINDQSIYDIKIKHLLNMTSGIPYDVSIDIMPWMNYEDQVKYAFEDNLLSIAGNIYRYNDPGVHLLTYIVEEISGEDFIDFAEENLFAPLKIEKKQWDTDKNGRPYGSHSLWLKARDMLKLGQLFLEGGVWEGERIISEEWIELATSEQSSGGSPYRGRYGYLWWLDDIEGYQTYYAAGYGGQFIFSIPELNSVIAITSNIDRHRDFGLKILVSNYVVPVLE